ncbi:MAG: hypothetical protein AAF226_18350, partial [Verrucomicrobiota bacterium]
MLTISQITEYVLNTSWRDSFDSYQLAAGAKLARGKRVKQVSGEIFADTGDAEIKAVVLDDDGNPLETSIILWKEGENWNLETECTCSGAFCMHGAAILEYLVKGKGARVEMAFGVEPEGETVAIEPVPDVPEVIESPPPSTAGDVEKAGAPTFLMRVERRPQRERMAWLPEIYCHCYAVYGNQRVPLDPTRTNVSFQGEHGKVMRFLSTENQSVQALLQIGLLPGREKPPQSLKKLEPPPVEGTLWGVNPQQHPNPNQFWQKFRHLYVPRMEAAGWEVQFAPEVELIPLVFKTEGWQAEIVE